MSNQKESMTGTIQSSEFTCSPRDFIDGVRSLYEEWLHMTRKRDPSLVGLPDMVAAIDYVEKHGIGPCE